MSHGLGRADQIPAEEGAERGDSERDSDEAMTCRAGAAQPSRGPGIQKLHRARARAPCRIDTGVEGLPQKSPSPPAPCSCCRAVRSPTPSAARRSPWRCARAAHPGRAGGCRRGAVTPDRSHGPLNPRRRIGGLAREAAPGGAPPVGPMWSSAQAGRRIPAGGTRPRAPLARRRIGSSSSGSNCTTHWRVSPLRPT